jgi:hypothetical protein
MKIKKIFIMFKIQLIISTMMKITKIDLFKINIDTYIYINIKYFIFLFYLFFDKFYI